MDVRIYDVAGSLVRVLASRSFGVGVRDLGWDGRNDRGNPVASGIYLVRVTAGTGEHITKRLVVQR